MSSATPLDRPLLSDSDNYLVSVSDNGEQDWSETERDSCAGPTVLMAGLAQPVAGGRYPGTGPSPYSGFGGDYETDIQGTGTVSSNSGWPARPTFFFVQDSHDVQ